MNEMSSANVKLSFLERFGYGVGDYSANLIYSSISAFLLLYYTNAVGASAAAAASIIAVSKIFDGVSDLVMGMIVDRTHSNIRKGETVDPAAVRSLRSRFRADVFGAVQPDRQVDVHLYVPDL